MIDMIRVRGTRLSSFVLATVLGACTTDSVSKVEPLYRDLCQDRARVASDIEAEQASDERQAERRAEVRRIIDAHGLSTAEDYWMAAVVLVESDEIEDLELSNDLARRAAAMGDPTGLRVAAEAFDKQLVKRGAHQRYGTQFYFDSVTQAWRLYPLDPRTTDEERRAMGVGSLEELHRDEARLNGR